MSNGRNKGKKVKRTVTGVVLNRNGNPINNVMSLSTFCRSIQIERAKRVPKYLNGDLNV